MSMSNDKSGENTGRLLYKSEIFKDGPKTASNYSSSVGAEQGLGFWRRGDLQETPKVCKNPS